MADTTTAAAALDQTERAYQKQPIFLGYKKLQAAKSGKALRFTRSVGLGFKTPETAIKGEFTRCARRRAGWAWGVRGLRGCRAFLRGRADVAAGANFRGARHVPRVRAASATCGQRRNPIQASTFSRGGRDRGVVGASAARGSCATRESRESMEAARRCTTTPRATLAAWAT